MPNQHCDNDGKAFENVVQGQVSRKALRFVGRWRTPNDQEKGGKRIDEGLR